MSLKGRNQMLLDEISGYTGFTLKQSNKVLNAIIKVITEALQRREKVLISDFGTFYVKESNPKRYNILKYWGLPIPEHGRQHVHFRPSAGLRNLVDPHLVTAKKRKHEASTQPLQPR